MKIYYPTNKWLGETSSVIYDYLLHGFKQLGEVIIDPNLDLECRNFAEPNYPNHLTVFYIEIDGNKHRVIYDWSDFAYYHPEVRQENDFYFKIHFTKELYNQPRVYPIGQTVGNMDYIYNLDKLRNIVDKCEKENNYKQDLVCVYRTTNYDIRLKAVEILKKSNLKCVLGLKDFNAGVVRPFAPKEFKKDKLIPYMEHMIMQAKSKYILALPAVDNSRAWRHTEAWGLGVPLLALDLKSISPNLTKNDYICIEDDLSNLILKINQYNRYDGSRVMVGLNGRDYFDNNLSPIAMAKNIINKVKENL